MRRRSIYEYYFNLFQFEYYFNFSFVLLNYHWIRSHLLFCTHDLTNFLLIPRLRILQIFHASCSTCLQGLPNTLRHFAERINHDPCHEQVSYILGWRQGERACCSTFLEMLSDPPYHSNTPNLRNLRYSENNCYNFARLIPPVSWRVSLMLKANWFKWKWLLSICTNTRHTNGQE